jgi:4-hydroxybenzoate polyprenyltransferase
MLSVTTWIWLHLLQANVSNQCHSGDEDSVDKPWRPIPSGRVTRQHATWLRWLLLPACLYLSISYGYGVAFASAALSLVEFVHDDLRLSGHPVFKNACNVGGYVTFELGASLVLSMYNQP